MFVMCLHLNFCSTQLFLIGIEAVAAFPFIVDILDIFNIKTLFMFIHIILQIFRKTHSVWAREISAEMDDGTRAWFEYERCAIGDRYMYIIYICMYVFNACVRWAEKMIFKWTHGHVVTTIHHNEVIVDGRMNYSKSQPIFL